MAGSTRAISTKAVHISSSTYVPYAPHPASLFCVAYGVLMGWLAGDQRPGSKKHQYALLWGSVKVVHPRWLYESVEKRGISFSSSPLFVCACVLSAFETEASPTPPIHLNSVLEGRGLSSAAG
jgi:hypothetical protein